jgi:hypothetical protein
MVGTAEEAGKERQVKIKYLIDKMSDNTEILIYSEQTSCKMPTWGDCHGGDDSYEYDCRDCSHYLPRTSEWTKYHGAVKDCPIKLSNLTVSEINNAYHEVQVTKRKAEKRHLIAIKVLA